MKPVLFISDLHLSVDRPEINRLFFDSTQTTVEQAQRLTVVADARSNSLMVRSENPSRLFRLRSLVAILKHVR